MGEFTTFIRYIFIPSGFLKDFVKGLGDLLVPKRLIFLFIFSAILSFFFLPYNRQFVAVGFFFLALFIQFRLIYKAGDHNKWSKERLKKSYNQKGKKGKDLTLGNSLDTQSNSGEENLQSCCTPDVVDNHPSDNYKGVKNGN